MPKRDDVVLLRDILDAIRQIELYLNRASYRRFVATCLLQDFIPRPQFDVPIQATVGNKVLSRANVKAICKDVLVKCYGGDITGKRKRLEKQKAGKKRMKMIGSVRSRKKRL